MYDERDLDVKSLKRDLPELFRPEYDGGYLLENGEIDWRSMRRDLPELFKPYFDGGYLIEEKIYSSSNLTRSDLNNLKTHVKAIIDILDGLDDEGYAAVNDFSGKDGRYSDMVEWLQHLYSVKNVKD